MQQHLSGRARARWRPLAEAVLLLGLVLPAAGAGADGLVSGIVKDGLSGRPLPDVDVQFRDCRGESAGTARTDAAGQFTSASLPAGTYFAITRNSAGYIDQLWNGAECSGYCDPIVGTPINVVSGGTARITFALRPGGRISGTVTGPAGPAMGTTVHVYNERGEWVTDAPAGADGSYVTPVGLPSGAYFLLTENASRLLDELWNGHPCACGHCRPREGTPVLVTLPLVTSGIDFALDEGGAIAGRLTDAAGAPVTGSVSIDGDASGSCGFVVTDADGRYLTTRGLPTGSYRVTARPRDNFIDQTYDGVTCPGVPPLTPTAVAVTAPATHSGIDFRLRPGGVVIGSVVDTATGAPVRGASVLLYAAADGAFVYGVPTLADGTYRIAKLCPASYQAVATGPRRSGLVRQVYSGMDCLTCPPGTGTPFTVDPAPAVKNGVDFRLKQGGHIAGTILDFATGLPRRGVAVTVYDAGGAMIGSGSTDCHEGGYVAPDNTGLTSGDYVATSGASQNMPYSYGYRVQLYNLHDCLFCDRSRGEPITVTEPATAPGVDFRLVRGRRGGDYERDGRANIAVYQPSGTWLIRSPSGSTTTAALGGAGWQPVPGDFDRDGKTDPAVFNASAGWRVLLSSTGSLRTYAPLGVAGDPPVRGDFDGDGRADTAVYHPATGLWTIRWSTTLATHTTALGGPRQVPVPGDYDGDRQDDLAVYDLDRGTWSILHSSGRLEIVTFGASGQAPVPFDFDGDGRMDLATHQPSTGLWTIKPSSSGTMKNFVLGPGGSVPVPLDYDGDGRTDAAFYQPSTGHWRIRLSGTEALVDVDYALGTPLN